jgi:hypothetical protein
MPASIGSRWPGIHFRAGCEPSIQSAGSGDRIVHLLDACANQSGLADFVVDQA